ncbi:hypothetical protein GOP47_0014880 [Adiantum capillus-veneris]|uniref:Uncharacterized protein n=1 Tax=Adiantum capillus-veneris TaxID=13818 RepID=A0A9D4ZDX4_ADICA|nr:hypothetical protein GOP47_0014880 [Adiantum capillus-veneris]
MKIEEELLGLADVRRGIGVGMGSGAGQEKPKQVRHSWKKSFQLVDVCPNSPALNLSLLLLNRPVSTIHALLPLCSEEDPYLPVSRVAGQTLSSSVGSGY